LIKNLFGQKQAGRVWNQHLHKGLTEIGFTQSKYEECLYFRNVTILLVYVDDLIIMSHEESDVDKVFHDIQAAGFDINCVGTLNEYLGIEVQQQRNGNIHLKQPTMIKQILHSLSFNQRTKAKQNPAKIRTTLNRGTTEPTNNATWDYRSIIGKLNYIEQTTRPDIAFAAHQAARFQSNPKKPHSDAVKWLGRYLHGTSEEGIILQPDDELFEVYADADFAGTWNRETAGEDSDTARSRLGYIIKFAGCPITWASRLISEIVLSTTEAEYVALSESLRTVIPLLNIYKECQQRKIVSKHPQTKVYCKVFEDNSGALEMAKNPKFRPRTKHLNIKYHHFRSWIAQEGEDTSGKIQIHAIQSSEQQADMLTKAVDQARFVKFRRLVCGW